MQKNSPEDFDFELHRLVNWSSLDEIVRITNKLAESGEKITRESLLANSDIKEDIDLIIRTGNRRSLSSFAPLSGQYAELYFMDTLFPDLTVENIETALNSFNATSKARTFGL